MTQKRGLGRGLGALIPSAPAPSAQTNEENPTKSAADVENSAEVAPDPPKAAEAPSASVAAEPEPAAAEASLSPSAGTSPSRPSDMFFGSGSGDSAEDSESADRPRRDRPTRDIAGEMAAAARSRKRKSSAPPARKGTAAASGAANASRSPHTVEAADEATTAPQTARPRDAATIPASAATPPEPVDPGVSEDGAVLTGARDWTPVRSASGTDQDAPWSRVGDEDSRDEERTADPAAVAAPSAVPDRGLLPVPGAQFAEIPLDEIRVNPKNPRVDFDEDELQELAASIREVGVLQPIVVRPVRADDLGRSFEIVMGERRWRATQRSGLTRIPAIVRETGDDDLLRDALIENLHRTQLNPLEEAAAYAQLLEDFHCTQDELADRVGRSRPQISNTLRLMKLPGLVQKRVASGALSAGHARALLAVDDVNLMEELAQRIVSEGLSVRQTEALVSRGQQPAARPTARRSTYDPRVVNLTSQVSNRLQTPVRIDVGKRKGKMTVEFTNLDDLQRIIEELGL